MNDLEQRMRELKLHEPSPELDEAVIGMLRHQNKTKSVPLTWAVAASIVFGAICFWGGLQWQNTPAEQEEKPAQIQVYIIDRSGENPFDFTQSFPQFYDGEVEVKTIPAKGSEI